MSEIEINTEADFLRWLDTGRQLGIETLVKAGFTEEQIKNLLKYGPPGLNTTVRGKGFNKPIVVDAILQAAFKILLLVATIKDRVTGRESVPPFRFVLDGVLLNDYRREIYESVWFQQDFNKKQKRSSSVPRGSVSITGRFAETLAHLYQKWPDARVAIQDGGSIGAFEIDAEGGDLVRITDDRTGDMSNLVKLDSIRVAFNRAKKKPRHRTKAG